MKTSPSVLCVGILPLAGLSIVAAVIFVMHGGDTSVPGFWLSMFMVGSPLTIFLTGILVHVRWRDRTVFRKVDWLAVAFGSVAALTFAGILLSMYLKTRKLEHELPNTRAKGKGRIASLFHAARPWPTLPQHDRQAALSVFKDPQ